MFRFRRFILLPTAGALLLALAACSDDTPGSDVPGSEAPSAGVPGSAPPPPAAADSETAALKAELAAIQSKLGPLQSQAMEDTELREEFRALEEAIENAMIAWDAKLPEHRQRLGELEKEFRIAEDAGNEEEKKALMEEGSSLNTKIHQARSQALANPDIVAKMGAFQDQVLARMAEIDPEAKNLIDRANVIANQLSGGPAGG